MSEERVTDWDYLLNGRVARFDWDACETCQHYPPAKGGCEIGAPDDLSNFQFDPFGGDTLLCRKWEPKPSATEAALTPKSEEAPSA